VKVSPSRVLVTQNSLPSGSVITMHQPMGSSFSWRTVAPASTNRWACWRARTRPSSPSTPALARMSRCTLFLAVLPSGTGGRTAAAVCARDRRPPRATAGAVSGCARRSRPTTRSPAVAAPPRSPARAPRSATSPRSRARRTSPTVSLVGPTYDPEELAGRKVIALIDRAEARDFADVLNSRSASARSCCWSAQQRSTRDSIRKCLQRC